MRAPVLLSILSMLVPSVALAQLTPYRTIASSGPLTAIHLGDEGSVQVAHATDGTTHEFYPPSTIPGDSGTFIAMDGVLYAPNFEAHDGSATGNIGTYVAFTPVSQTATAGAGTVMSPYRLVTVYAAGATGITITQADTYVVGEESYRTDLLLTNSGTVTRTLILYRAADCYLGGSDSGFGAVDMLSGAVACSVNADNVPAGRIEQWLPISAGSSFYQARYSEVWTWIGTMLPFPNTCECTTQQDNGAGISWQVTIAPGGNAIRSHLTTFSPIGSLPLTLAKMADTATVTAGSRNGYSVLIDNRNAFEVNVTNVIDLLPAGFSYVPGSTSGALTIDPAITTTTAGQVLTWTATITVPALGAAMFHFEVVVGTATGTFYNNAAATAANVISVSPTGDTAPVHVLPGQVEADAGVSADGAVTTDGGPDLDGSLGDAAEPEDGGNLDGGVLPDSGSTTPDSGSAGPDAGSSTADAGSTVPDAGGGGEVPERMDDGCDCSAASRGSSTPWLLFGLGTLLVLRRRR